MSLKRKLYALLSKDKKSVRSEIVTLFLEEKPGTGKGNNTSKYEYTVEEYDKYSIVLKRPAVKNKGFDFVITINSIYFKTSKRKRQYPKHDDIIEALKQLKQTIGDKKYETIKKYLNQIYKLKEPDYTKISNYKYIDYLGQEHPFIIILLAVKRLFIEQDITYWNWSGRNMLKTSLEEKGIM